MDERPDVSAAVILLTAMVVLAITLILIAVGDRPAVTVKITRVPVTTLNTYCIDEDPCTERTTHE